VGSRSRTDLAYIAGFLDGDGSLMLQLKKRKDGKSQLRFMTTICLYQDTRHEKTLEWMRNVFGIGYLSRRKDGITELRINGYQQVNQILRDLQPFIKFKKVQTDALLQASAVLSETTFSKLDQSSLILLIELILVIQNANYVTKKKRSKEELYEVLGLTP